MSLAVDLVDIIAKNSFEWEDKPVKIRSIIEVRCTGCHAKDVGGSGAAFPLKTWQDIERYLKPEAPARKP